VVRRFGRNIEPGACHRTQADIKRAPNRSVRVIIPEGARNRGTLFPAEGRRLGAEAHELVDPLRQLFDAGLLRGDGVGHPCLRNILKLTELMNEVLGEKLGCPSIRGHINAARLHDDGVDETIDTLEMDRAASARQRP
jgi:hypothetical protein